MAKTHNWGWRNSTLLKFSNTTFSSRWEFNKQEDRCILHMFSATLHRQLLAPKIFPILLKINIIGDNSPHRLDHIREITAEPPFFFLACMF